MTGGVRVRVRGVALVALAGVGAVLAVLLALAGNAATSSGRWPGPVDGLRQNPWLWVAALMVASVVAAGAAVWIQERPSAGRDDPPPPPLEAVPGWFVDRAQTGEVVAAVCRRGGRAVGITTSLWGAGGFGKTTLATAVCAHRRVRRRFRSRVYPVTVGREVRGRAAVAAKVAEVTRFITGDATEFDDPDLAGRHLGRLLDQRPAILLVLDDVWEEEQLAPFVHGGRRCVRLVTTRNPALLPSGARRIPVDQMSLAQARAVLTWELPPLPGAVIDGLLQVTGRWALLLRLTNRLIAEQIAAGADPAACAEQILRRLREHGPVAVDGPATAWDLDDPRLRNQAARASIEAATTLLPPGGADRFSELGIFAEDEPVPISVIALLWQATGGLSEDQTRLLCRKLEHLSLLALDPQGGGRVSLHDVIRDYLREAVGPVGLTDINGRLVDAVATTLPSATPLTTASPDSEHAWWQLDDSYLLDHLIGHLLAAGRTTCAEAAAGDLRWVETRLAQRGPTAPWSDLTCIPTPSAIALARSLAQTAHLLTPTTPPHALVAVLHNRLDTYPHWRPQVAARRQNPALRPCLANRWPVPDSPHPALHRTLTGHTGTVRSVAISPDGTWLATTGSDATVRIWDRASATCTATLTGHTSPVTSMTIAPNGAWLATGSGDGTVRVWDRATRRCTATLTGHTSPVTSMTIAPNGAWLATGSGDGTVRVWDRATRRCTATLTGHTGWVTSMTIAPDGTWVATIGSDGGTVRVWDRISGVCITTSIGHIGTVALMAISPDGTWLAATGYRDTTVRIWDRASGTCTATLTGHTGSVESVAISPDGTWLATTSSDATVRIWDRAPGTCTATLTGHTGSVESVAISPDGTWLATTSDDGTVRIWDRAPGTRAAAPNDYTDPVESVAISPDGTWLATTGNRDTTVRIWDRASATCTATLTGHTGSVESVAISPDGTWLATASGDGTMRIWDRASGTCTATLTGSDRTVRIRDATGGRTATFTEPIGWVRSVAISSDGAWLATGSDNGTVRIWDQATGRCTVTLTGHTHAVTAVAISSDGAWLATTGNRDTTVRIWDRASGTCTATLTGSDNGAVRIWDQVTGRYATVFTGHNDWVRSVAISPNGTWLATTSNDGTVRIWDRGSSACTATLTGHTGPVGSVAISPDGTWLATASDDGTVRIWDVANQHAVTMARAEQALTSCAWAHSGHELAVGGRGGLYLFSFLT